MQNNSHYIAALIKRQWIRDVFVDSDLFTIDVIDEDFTGGYRPMVFTMGTLKDVLLDELSFINMPDTPDEYEGMSGYIAVVNPAEDGLMFVDNVDSFLELTDTPVDYTDFAGYTVVVNQAEDGLEFVPQVFPSVYEARLTFNGAIDPVVDQQLVSNLGAAVTWSRVSLGVFRATFSVPINSAKLSASCENSSDGTFHTDTFDNSYVQFSHYDFTGTLSDPTSLIQSKLQIYI